MCINKMYFGDTHRNHCNFRQLLHYENSLDVPGQSSYMCVDRCSA